MTTDANPDLESTPPYRECWANCGVDADEEMREIDRLEDELSPLPEPIPRIRKLISTLELCHHKAERWVTNIIEAIGEGDTSKGLGTRRRTDWWRAGRTQN